MLLKEQVTLVTGGGAGIGEAIAKRFAQVGAKVVVNDIDPTSGQNVVDEISKRGGEVSFIQGDTSREADAERMVRYTVEKFGALDILINNAGIEIVKALHEMTVEEWDSINNINLKGVFLVARAAARQMLMQDKGVMVNISSVAGLIGIPMLGAYGVTKHGVIGLTKVMALELRPQNIRVNALCPGFIGDTKMFDRVLVLSEAQGIPVHDACIRLQGCLGTPDQVAGAALFLASDESSFISGVALPIDIGVTAGCGF